MTPVSLYINGAVRDLWTLDHTGIDIREIASCLAKLNRFVGHTPYPYSVAQHAVLVSHLCSPRQAYEGLHHDDTEAFVGDLASPIKRECPEFVLLESAVRGALAPVLGLAAEEPAGVKAADSLALLLEQYLVQGRAELKGYVTSVLEARRPETDLLKLTREMSWREARDLYLSRHAELAWPWSRMGQSGH